MSENKNVQDTHISEQMKALHGALIRVVSALNRPRNDEKLIAEAGIQLDRALFSILISIERLGPIGVVELASRTGKAMTERIDAAREQMGNVVFKDWPQDELDVFVRLMQKFADAMDSDASMPE